MRRQLISLFALALFLWEPSATEAKAVGNFEVISVEGNVSESQDGQSWSKTAAATILEPQDWLKTDGSGWQHCFFQTPLKLRSVLTQRSS